MIQIIEQTYDEKMRMYLKFTKKQLAEMLIEANRIIGPIPITNYIDWNENEIYSESTL